MSSFLFQTLSRRPHGDQGNDQTKVKVKGKGNYLTSVAKQAKTAFLHGPTVCRSPIVGIEPATFRSESAALT